MKRKSTILLSLIISLFLILAVFTVTACGAVDTSAQSTDTENTTATTDSTETNATETAAGDNAQTAATDNAGSEDNTGTEETVTEYTVTFVTDEHVTVTIYDTQDVSGTGTEGTTAYARNGETGAIATDGTGQVNYVLTFDEGYELSGIEATPTTNYNKNKSDPENDGSANYYRLTKVSGDVTVTVSSQETGAEEDLTQGYQVTFVTDGHATVTVYKTQDLTDGTVSDTAYSRDGASGLLTKSNGQVNFVVTAEEGYEVISVVATPTENYKNLKTDPEEDGSDNYYRITKITNEVTVTVTTQEK